MNERIRQLLNQATSGLEPDLSLQRTVTLNEMQKFAQLIMRECLRELRYTVLDTQELRRDKSTDYQVGWEDGMFDAGEMIKQHFGVEE
jgi:hypothetical protein